MFTHFTVAQTLVLHLFVFVTFRLSCKSNKTLCHLPCVCGQLFMI